MLKRRPYIALLLLPAVYDLVYPSATGHLVVSVAALALGLVYVRFHPLVVGETMFRHMTAARWVAFAITITLTVIWLIRPTRAVGTGISAMLVTVTMLNWRQRITGRRW